MNSPQLLVVGLGPAGLDRIPALTLRLLDDPDRRVIVRTLNHPACRELAQRRTVESCDDIYIAASSLDGAYSSIADRVMGAASAGPVAYAVPGSAVVGERAVTEIRERAGREGVPMRIVPGESFLDLIFAEVGLDPIATPVKIVDGRSLPDPLVLDATLVITQLDRPEVVADVGAELGRVLDDDTQVTFVDRLGDPDQTIRRLPLMDVAGLEVGPRSSLVVDCEPAGWYGLVQTNRILRRECPWDRKQTHHSLLSHLIEEAYETADSIRALPAGAPGGEPDFGAYAEVEEELGDLLLQIVFHATLAREVGAFDVEEVAEITRRKLIRRHPHVFGDVVADDATTVITNWEAIKREEKSRDSLMDDIPTAMPAITRADKMQRRARSVGFDWTEITPVFAKIEEELAELGAVVEDRHAAQSELGDLLFAAVNLARHLEVDAEVALADASDRFASRIRLMEGYAADAGRSLADYDLEELDALWERAKTTR